MAKCILVKWLEGDAKGYTDQFPAEDFAQETRGAERVHLVIGPQGGEHHARCWVTVNGSKVKLDYTKFSAFNRRHDMVPGLMELIFVDQKRQGIPEVTWDEEQLGEVDVAVTVVEWAELAAESEQTALRKYGLFPRLLRPGQAALYAELERTYGGCCAVSGCPVPFALEAAHLIPVSESGSDSPTNAVLLRADLHALLDCNQMAIAPKNRKVYFSPEARGWPAYSRLHGKRTLSNPQSGFSANAVNAQALESRWRAFVEQHGDVISASENQKRSRR